MKFDFEKIKSSITKTMLKTKETSTNMVEVAKAKYKLSEIKSDIDDKYIEIGKIVYKTSDGTVFAEITKFIKPTGSTMNVTFVVALSAAVVGAVVLFRNVKANA